MVIEQAGTAIEASSAGSQPTRRSGTKPSAKIIADSISPQGVRLTTMEVVIHRFVLSEMNTHRIMSKNSGSSRAVPVRKQLERVMNDPAIPLVWASEKPGMQGGQPLQPDEAEAAERTWLEARDCAVRAVEILTSSDLVNPVHKSIANRLLEPFMWHTVIVSSTEWDNFFAQRCSELAQPEIEAAAAAMRSALNLSEPVLIEVGQWHLPYVLTGEFDDLDIARKASVARCARVSYLTHDGRRSVEKDLDLYQSLVGAVPMHASPLEHVATPAQAGELPAGNFRGWRQLRHTVESDSYRSRSEAVDHSGEAAAGHESDLAEHRYRAFRTNSGSAAQSNPGSDVEISEGGPTVERSYRPDGKVGHEVHRQNGKLQDPADGNPAERWYWPDGSVEIALHYQDGALQDPADGSPAARWTRTDGSVVSETHFQNGVRQEATPS